MNKPRKHDPNWKDGTVKKRQQRRRETLNRIAREAGYKSWSAYETAVINQQVTINPA
jgi:hypothetical protein